MAKKEAQKQAILIDAHSLIHRCFHAVPPLTNSKGAPTGALYGVASVLLKIIQRQHIDYIAAAFDRPEPTIRKQRYDQYKIHRPPASNELVSQLIESRNLFTSFSIPVLEKPGYEGDDIIGTCVDLFTKQENNIHVTILTGDLDALQLIDDERIVVETFKKGITDTVIYNAAAVVARYHITPAQFIDFKALVGDASDNIPGVAGIGEKTATEILTTYGSLDTFLAQGSAERFYKKIADQRDQAFLSKELATIHRAVPLHTSIQDLTFAYDPKRIESYFIEQDFTSLIKRLTSSQTALPTTSAQPSKNVPQEKEETPLCLCVDDQGQNVYVGYDIKNFFKEGPVPLPYFDVRLAHELIGISARTWRELSLQLFKKELPYEDCMQQAYTLLGQRITKSPATRVWEDIELPLIPIIARMEKNGVLIDRAHLTRVGADLDKAIAEKEALIQKTTGSININSPKQLGTFLSTTYHLPITSTAADKLKKIEDTIPLVKDIVAYRELFKLQTTYVRAFEKLVATDGRIHPTFLQLGAATGRLSCTNPNLQNIPQESSWSHDIRNIFIAPPHTTFVACDYSQIELRVVATLANDTHMIEAFQRGDDIHTLTAHKIFHTPIDAITKAQRRLAKTLNFGMVYGMGSRALAQQSGLSSASAKEFIETYFKEFSSIKRWQEHVLDDARTQGMVINRNGRFRNLPALRSPNRFIASGAEREAINMPVQSLAADILKDAMLATDQYIQSHALRNSVALVLSIHDELIFTVQDDLLTKGKESDVVIDLQHAMEQAYQLTVPLKTDVRIASAWGDVG